MMKSRILLACTALVALSGIAQAQVANISTTDAVVTGVNTGAGMQNAATSMWFANDGETLLVLKGAATAVTATIKTQATQMSQAGYGTVSLTDQTVSVPSSSVVIAGPFPTGRWNTGFGTVAVSMSAISGVSATSVRVPQ